ncbi:hypothetical protein [Paraburkholderia xenovorans]|uniref:hypothetical protein n=1 Tax=Paraburkholderia xenovorans TaxID=36873 RepID=UPI001C130F75|nr:hypothetical protein [Paraburkholderia xenovorans]
MSRRRAMVRRAGNRSRCSTGRLVGYYRIAKWRNLNAAERRELDGTMTGDMRHGPATINLKGEVGDYPHLSPDDRMHFSGSD